jgi:hypothetical protein
VGGFNGEPRCFFVDEQAVCHDRAS